MEVGFYLRTGEYDIQKGDKMNTDKVSIIDEKGVEHEITDSFNTKPPYIREAGNEYDLMYINNDGTLNLDNLAKASINMMFDEDFKKHDPFKLLTDNNKNMSFNHTFDLGYYWDFVFEFSSIGNWISDIEDEILLLKMYNLVMKRKMGW
jgi:hypothetical protein